jgi:ribonuclease E
MRLPPEIAHWILNHKREDLSSLERRYQVRILVEPKGSLLRHESEFEFFPREKVEVPPALVTGDRPVPPAPPDLVDLERGEDALVEPAAVAAAESSETESAESAERKRRRRRRGRRGGRGRGANASDPEAVPAEAAAPAQAQAQAQAPESVVDLADAIDDEDGDDALEDPAGDVSDIAADGEGSSAEETEGQKRRRRRRRGRRGRGRARVDGAAVAPAAVVPNGGLAPSHDPQPAEDEPFVPRGVVAHELMPAATGGRRRGRRGGRGRRGFTVGEPADPQLISPQNPVPKPRFDED